jgi:hypothetical protein
MQRGGQVEMSPSEVLPPRIHRFCFGRWQQVGRLYPRDFSVMALGSLSVPQFGFLLLQILIDIVV